MKIVLDHEGCIGCGLCISTCPTVFQMAEDGRAHTVQPAVTEQEQQDLDEYASRFKNDNKNT